MLTRSFVVGLCCSALLACSSGDPSMSMDMGEADLAERPQVCLTLDESIEAALTTLQASSGADTLAISVTVPACGEKTYAHSAEPTLTVPPEQLSYKIGSNTKMFVASALLELSVAGKIDLDAKVSTLLPALPGVGDATVRQCLNHTSGLFNYTDDHATFVDPQRKFMPEELVAIAAAHPAYFAPGTGWHYSNTNYIIAGMLIEKITGEPVAVHLRKTLVVPQGLTTTYFDGEEAALGALAVGRDKSGFDVSHERDPSWAWAAGAMVAPLSELARWTERRASGLVHGAAAQAQLEDGAPTEQPFVSYGLGVFIIGAEQSGGLGRGLGHGGDIAGYHTSNAYFPAKKATIACAVASDSGTGNDLLVAALKPVLAATK